MQNEAGKPNGNGKLSVFYGSIGKSWHIKNTAEHNISGNAGFMYTGGFGSATPEPSENYMFYPFSYLHANGGFSCYFVSISGKYEFTFNNLKLALEAETFINIYSNINYFYKYTFKKNILYDGSIHRGNDNFSFSNGDFILLANLDASYKTTIVKTAAVKVTAEFFISKDIVLPVMTEKTKLLFRSKNNQQPSNVKELDLQFNFKTILLSGLSLGVKISL